MTAPVPTRSSPAGLARVGAYYAALALATFLLVRYVPLVGEAVSGGVLGGLGGPGADEIFGAEAPPAVGRELGGGTWYNALLASVSMLGALAIMVPVTWIYILTRRHRGYEESVVHTLLILPVAVTGIVMIVKSSVALAFSLAGIVAAVRFRTTLEDTKDAVYVFLAIGVGLACGVQAVGVALALSVVFNTVVLVLWRTRFGDSKTDASMAAASTLPSAERAGPAGGLEWQIAEERAREKGKRANALLVVRAKSAASAQERLEGLLEDFATRWRLAEVVPREQGFTLSYLVRLDGAAAQGGLMDRLRTGDGVIEDAELRSLKGIAP
jgi:hypothetical protein